MPGERTYADSPQVAYEIFIPEASPFWTCDESRLPSASSASAQMRDILRVIFDSLHRPMNPVHKKSVCAATQVATEAATGGNCLRRSMSFTRYLKFCFSEVLL
jgi:hypothetical protein